MLLSQEWTFGELDEIFTTHPPACSPIHHRLLTFEVGLIGASKLYRGSGLPYESGAANGRTLKVSDRWYMGERSGYQL